ncbi:MAG TPA: ATP-binding protein [Opitutaceae bacterium]|nr:ATP-binding protein [Opitutaceae bacterium]
MNPAPLHNLLRRQLKRSFGTEQCVPAEAREFVAAVNAAYYEADVDRAMLERALELSSQELLQASAEMRTVFQAIPDLLIRLDGRGNVLDLKLGTARISTVSGSEEETGRRRAILAAHVDDRFYAAAVRAVAEQQIQAIEYAIERDGGLRHFEARLAPVLENQVVAFIRDITERRQAEMLRAAQGSIFEMIVNGASLHDTLLKLARLMESQVEGARCVVMLVDEEKKRLRQFAAPSVPPEFEPPGGVPIGEGFGSCGTAAARKQPVIVTDIAADPLWAGHVEAALSIDARACWSSPILSEQGSVLGTFAMYWRTPRAPRPGNLELLQIASQIAGIAIDRRRAELQLQRSVSLVRSTLESTADGILVVDRVGRIVSYNKRFVALWHVPKEVLEKADDWNALEHARGLVKNPDQFVRRVQEFYANPLAEGSDTVELKDGRVFERYSCPQLVDGAPIGRVWSFHDISQHRKLEAQFRQAQKMEAFGQLAGGVAHDFNNILTVIQMNLSLLRSDALAGPQRSAAIEDTLAAADRAANLTRQLLTFSRRQPIQPRDLDLNEIVASMTKMLKRLIGEHITLETRCAPGAAPVHADTGMLEQALMNLAVNARDAMPKSGRLVVSTEIVVLSESQARSRPRARPGIFVCLAVSDTGTGISPEHMPHIFEPFFTTKEVGRGTGLGLATVFGIVEQHAGWIEVDSMPAIGTTVRLFFPALKSAPPQRAPATMARPRHGTETILVVEDEADVRLLMGKMLQTHGYRVHAAGNAIEALQLWARCGPEVDLLITDMVMPGGIGGRDLAKRLVAQKPALRVIYCSGYSDEMLGADSPLRRSANFLEKPFDVHGFLAQVRRCLDAPADAAPPAARSA